MLAMKLFTLAVAITYKKIWLLFTFIEQQFSDLYTLVLTHMDNIGYIVLLTYHYLDALRNDIHFNSALFASSIFSVSKFITGVASWVEEVVTDLEKNLR